MIATLLDVRIAARSNILAENSSEYITEGGGVDMKRTWKDAACEVAWTHFEVYKNSVCLKCFLAGRSANWFSHEPTQVYAHNKTFAEYRAEFMKWLEENKPQEVK